MWLRSLGADVLAYALPPDTEPSLFREMFPENPENSVLADILDSSALNSVMSAFRPEIVFHLAAQPLVRRSYLQPVRTYASNVMGTLNVLEAARACGSVKAFVNVTTDKCYENRETGEAYSEGAALGGYDMYSSSKACSEILSASYRRSFLKDSVRPWQHVLEPLSGYLLLGALLFARGSEYAEAFNFGPEPGNVLKVKDVVSKITDKFSYTFEPHYFIRVNDFNSSNGKDHHWEITNTFRYRINEHWLPYFELRWLDRNVEPYHREQNQIRIGTKYFF